MKNVLIAFGTRYGATGKTAQEISQILRENSVQTRVMNLDKENPSNLEQFDLVILGSGIKTGKWTKQVCKFVEKHIASLSSIPLALFVCSGGWPLMEPDGIFGSSKELSKASELTTSKERAQQLYLEDFAENYNLHPISLGLFGGIWDFQKMGGFWRVLLKGFKKDLENKGVDTSIPLDNRDPERIHAWAREVYSML